MMLRFAFKSLTGLLLLFLINVAGYAEPLAQVPLKEKVPAGKGLTGTLTYDVFLDQVRAHHPKLYSSDLERRIAGAKYLEKQGAFDPGVSLESDYLRYNDFTKRGKVSKAFDNDLSINWLSRSGIKLATGARYNTGNIKPPLYPTGDTGEYFMSVRMPLLRGFRVNEKVAAEKQAEIGIPIADAQYREARLELLLKASYGYWNWAFAHRKVTVAKDILKLAEVRYKAIKARVELGDLPPIDAVEAEQEVQRRKGGLTKSQREYEKQLFSFSRYLWESDGKPSALPLPQAIPAQLPNPAIFSDDDWMDGRQIALEKRPELKELNLQKEIIAVDLKYAKNLKLPVLDVFATPGYDTGEKSIGPTLKAGVLFTVPLRQRTANGMIAAAQFKAQKMDVEQRMLLQHILLQVDDAVSAIKASYDQYLAAREEHTLALTLEQGERDRFTLGDSTIFLVNQRERSTAEVAMKLLDLEAEYHQTIANFKAVSGQL